MAHDFTFLVGDDTTIGDKQLDALVSRAAGGPREHRSTTHAVYWDTPDLRLQRAGHRLRRSGRASPRDRTGAPSTTGAVGSGEWTLTLAPVDGRRDDHRARQAGEGRGEELRVAGRGEAMPERLRTLLRGVTLHAPLAPVASLAVQHRRLEVDDASGHVLLHVDDDRVEAARLLDHTVATDDAAQVRFVHSISIDAIVDEGADPAARLARRLRKAGADTCACSTATEHALAALSDVPTPHGPVPRALAEGTTVAQVIAYVMSRTASSVARHDPSARLGSDDEALHQLRAALRRMRYDLATTQAVIDPVWHESTCAELDWILAVLGAARDADVLAVRLRAAAERLHPPADPDALDALLERADHDRVAAHAALRGALDGERYLALLCRIDEASETVPLSADVRHDADAARLLRKGVKRALSRVEASVAAAGVASTPPPEGARVDRARGAAGGGADLADGGTGGGDGGGRAGGSTGGGDGGGRADRSDGRSSREADGSATDEALHRIRRRAKQARYAAELAALLHGAPARRLAKRLARLQDVLGELHDASGAAAWLEAAAEGVSPSAAFLAGRLHAAQAAHAERGRARWARTWRRVTSDRITRWV